MLLERAQPGVALEWGAEGARDARQRQRGDAHVGGEHRHIACQRLEWSKAEPLALGCDDDGVRRVDVERDALWRGVVVVDQLDALGHELTGPVDALFRSLWIGREEQVAAVLVEPELVAGLRPPGPAPSLQGDAPPD